MGPNEFITYCEMASYLKKDNKGPGPSPTARRVIIDKGNIHVEMLYNPETETIIKCYLGVGRLQHPNPNFTTVLGMFFPNDIA